MSGIDQEVKDFVKSLAHLKEDGPSGKTEDQDVPPDVPGIVNGPKGTAKWGIGKLHHVQPFSFPNNQGILRNH